MARRSSPHNLILGALCAVLLGAASPAPPVDFENFTGYPAPPCSVDDEHPPAFALRHGGYSWSTKAGDAGLDVQFRSASFGHLRGDASLQAQAEVQAAIAADIQRLCLADDGLPEGFSGEDHSFPMDDHGLMIVVDYRPFYVSGIVQVPTAFVIGGP